jgi:phosphoglycerate kinase
MSLIEMYSRMRPLTEVSVNSLSGRRILLRVDFNVPLTLVDNRVEVQNDKRIRSTFPTLRLLMAHGARVVIVSHLGRPNGKSDEQFSLRPVVARLQELLEAPVRFVDDCIGPAALLAANELHNGEVLILENIRFQPGEEANDLEFARQLAALADVCL